jgi:hypothetical protein
MSVIPPSLLVNLTATSTFVSVTAGGKSVTTTYQIESTYSSSGNGNGNQDEDRAVLTQKATMGMLNTPSGVTVTFNPKSFNLVDGTQPGKITFQAAANALPGQTSPILVASCSTDPPQSPKLSYALTVLPGFYTANASVTWWQLFMAKSMDLASPNELATAPVRDPLWMLARQWQLKEFAGADAGSAIQVRYLAQQVAVNRYLGGAGTVSVFNEQTHAMESAVESETVNLQLRGAIQLGLRFEAMLVDAGLKTLISQFRAAFPVTTPPSSALHDVRTYAYATLAVGSVTNGWGLYLLASTQPNSPTIPPGATAVVQAFVTWCAGLYVQPGNDPAWNAERITYNFGAGASQPGVTTLMQAPDFPGGRLDWYDFDAGGSSGPLPLPMQGFPSIPQIKRRQPASRTTKTVVQSQSRSSIKGNPSLLAQLATLQPPSSVTYVAGTTLPNHITFPGMPQARYWNFEDGRLNLGSIQPNLTDLANMLVLEFALVYSNDWFVVTVPTPIGSLTNVVGLVVTDTFGIRTLIEAADGTTTSAAGDAIWTMFTMSGVNPQMDTVLLAPTLTEVQDGSPIEEVWFARDDMAAMAWGEEMTLQGPLDNGINVYEDVTQHSTPTAQPATKSTTAEVAYVLGTGVPANWIPMVAIPNDFLYRLRRGAMAPLQVDPATKQPVPTPIYPRGVVLRQDQLQSGKPPMLLVRDSAIPPSGTRVTRYFRRARWIDGSTSCWIARNVTTGVGQANSGLAFDVLQPVTPAAS